MTPEERRAYNRRYYLAHREQLIADQTAYYKANRDRIRAQRAERLALHGDEMRAKDRARYRADPDLREKRRAQTRAWMERNNPRLRQHGLSDEQYASLIEEQGDACAICEMPFLEIPRIDHDHSTGDVRGLLCHNCNVAIGHFKDNPELMRRAIRYLGSAPFTFLPKESAA